MIEVTAASLNTVLVEAASSAYEHMRHLEVRLAAAEAERDRLLQHIARVQPTGTDDFGRPTFSRDACQGWFEDYVAALKENT